MLDGVSLDQLRTFIAAADEGSFSAAGRRIRRAQSVVSDVIRAFEDQVGVSVFDRSGRYPTLTPEGVALLADARGIVAGVDSLKARARSMAAGFEAVMTTIIDAFFPMNVVADSAKAFREQFPSVPLRIHVDVHGPAYQAILDSGASFGILGSHPLLPPTLVAERIGFLRLVLVAAADHPLASFAKSMPRAELAKHVQLALTDQADRSAAREFGVIAPIIWRLPDLSTKRTFLLNGLGWGGLPLYTVEADLADGRLVELVIEHQSPGGLLVPMSVIYPADDPPGPAGRWLIERLRAGSVHIG